MGSNPPQDAEAICNAENPNTRRIRTIELTSWVKERAAHVSFFENICATLSLICSHMLSPHLVYSLLHKPKCKCANCLQCCKAEHVANEQDSPANASSQISNLPGPHRHISSFTLTHMPYPHPAQLMLHASRCKLRKVFATLRSQTRVLSRSKSVLTPYIRHFVLYMRPRASATASSLVTT